jgi:hypothetical protein
MHCQFCLLLVFKLTRKELTSGIGKQKMYKVWQTLQKYMISESLKYPEKFVQWTQELR